MTFSQGLIALITGASSGIGEIYARKLASQGFNLILVARRHAKLQVLAEELEEKNNISAEMIIADLSVEEDILKVEAKIKSSKNIFYLINNAGFGTLGRFVQIDLEKHIEMMKVHVVTSTRLIHKVLPNMIEQNRGIIINVSSMGGLMKKRGNPTYGATKSYLNQFSIMLQKELLSTQIKVQALCPGYTHTEFHSVRDFEGFNKALIPKFLWMNVEDVVDISLKSLKKKRVIVIPGLKNRLYLRIVNSRIMGGFVIKQLKKRRKE